MLAVVEGFEVAERDEDCSSDWRAATAASVVGYEMIIRRREGRGAKELRGTGSLRRL